MVMVTRSSQRKACNSFHNNSSDVSEKNTVPPWCSSRKVYERKKSRKLPSPTWEIRSSYPLRENIWEYLYEDKRNLCKRKNRSYCKPTSVKNKRWWKTLILLTFLLLISGITFLWISDPVKETNLITKVFPKAKLITLLGLEEAAVDAECCYRMKHLAAALFRAEEALRHALRLRKNLITSKINMDVSNTVIDKGYIEGAKATRGRDTIEWGGRVALWGVVPLWRASPPLDTVLSLRRPRPSDCWPFSGSYGELLIDLPSKVRVRSVSVEHVRPDTALSAPKHFILYGILSNGTWIKAVDAEYKRNGPAKQYFTLYRNISLQNLVFRVFSNQGNARYTCIYRVHLYKSDIDNISDNF